MQFQTSAKLGDELGLNLWTAKSKYGATIQTALDFIMAQNPKQEDVSDIFPHVAAVAAAYGDPSGKYEKFLKSKDKNYGKEPYYLYNSPKAFRNAPTTKGGSTTSGSQSSDNRDAGNKGKGNKGKSKSEIVTNAKLARIAEKSPRNTTANAPISDGISNADPTDASADDNSSPNDETEMSFPLPTVPFECPSAFNGKEKVQLDDGIFVTCDDLKQFYGYVKSKTS